MGNSFFHFGKEKIVDPPSDFYSLSAQRLDNTEYSFQNLVGKKWIIIVNVSSYCELASKNFKQLSELYELYKYKIY